MKLCGVVLAGGKGTRLGELTRVTNKHLLPVGQFPMIYYPIKKMAGIGIKEILIVSGTEHMGDFVELLGSGSRFGVNLTYKVQDEAGGIAQALVLAERFCGDNHCVVILGDNIFHDDLLDVIDYSKLYPEKAWVVLKKVSDPQRYGVAKFSDSGYLSSIEEKPAVPASHFAVTGVYIYPPDVFEVIKTLKPSERGELEITDVNNYYLSKCRMGHSYFGGYWTDAGTPKSLGIANRYVNEDGCKY